MVIKNICLGFVGLLLCVLLLKIIFSMKRCDVGVWGWGKMCIHTFLKLFLVWKSVIGIFWGWDKMCEVCGYPFLNLKKSRVI